MEWAVPAYQRPFKLLLHCSCVLCSPQVRLWSLLPEPCADPIRFLQEGWMLLAVIQCICTNNSQSFPHPCNPEAQGSDPLIHQSKLRLALANTQSGTCEHPHTHLTPGSTSAPPPTERWHSMSPELDYDPWVWPSRPSTSIAIQVAAHPTLAVFPVDGGTTSWPTELKCFGFKSLVLRAQTWGLSSLMF